VTATCVTRSCTTGWADWIHGELWVLPDAFVRRRLSFAATQANRYGPTVAPPLPSADPASFVPADILAAHRTNKVLPFAAVAKAQLFRGFTAHGLALTMTDGTRHKLLWLTADPAHALLADVLPSILGERLLF
jgi:hypothetical protein